MLHYVRLRFEISNSMTWRHTFASHLVMAGVDITSVKELLGHKTLNMTMRYSHLSEGHKRKAVNTLDNVLNNTESKILHYKNTTISGSDLHTAYRKSFLNKEERGSSSTRTSGEVYECKS